MSHRVKGLCGITAMGGDCEEEAKGAWPVHGSPAQMLRQCRQRCERCANCQYVSLSARIGECSWYSACDFDRAALRNLGKRFAAQQNIPSELLDSFWTYQVPKLAGHGAGSCERGTQGTWTMVATKTDLAVRGLLQMCRAACRDCPRCRYISASARLHDCSWFSKCNLGQLEPDAEPVDYLSARVAKRDNSLTD